MKKSLMKSNYKQNSLALREILNESDFIGIYPSKGGPKDEYDCMIGPILSRLSKRITKEELETYLIKELKEHFGIAHPQLIQMSKATEKIMAWWNNK